MLLIFSVPCGMYKCFVSDNGTKGKKGLNVLSYAFMAYIRNVLRAHDVYEKYSEAPHITFQYLQHG
jgi:hypothetical protein